MKEFYISSNKYSVHERQTKRGKVYYIMFRVFTLDGQEKQIKRGGFSNKTLAKQGYVNFVTEKCELIKGNPFIAKDSTKNEHTVGELFKVYIASLNNQNKESVIYDKQNLFALFILNKYQNTKFSKLTKEELYKWQDELWSTKNPKTNSYYSFKYLSKIRNYFGSFLMWVENRYSYPNNFKYITKPKSRVSKTEMQIWSKEEFDTFIQAVDNPTYKMLFIMLFYTGRRKSEVLALSPKDINIKEGTINFSKTLTSKTIDGSLYKITSTKNEKKQISYICKPLKEALNKYNPQSPFFFGGDRPIPYTTLSRAFDTYISKSSVKPIRIHDLRHSFVSRAISLGGNLTVVARLISDSLEQVVRTYGHLVENDLKSLIEKL